MLIAIAGSQGSGKTTIIQELMKSDLTRKQISRKTSRSILTEWGVSLQQVNSNPELTLEFQEEIFKRKLSDDREAAQSNLVWFTERTPIDLLVYATLQLGSNNDYSDWLEEYGTRCISAVCNYNIYDFVVYLTAGHFSVVSDGVRGHNLHYSALVDAVMRGFYTRYLPSSKVKIIDTPDIQERVTQINNKILKINEQSIH